MLRKNELAVSGQVAWAKGRRAGIVFAAPLAPETVQRHLRGPKARGSEPMIKKRPGFRGRLSPEERRIAEQLGQDGSDKDSETGRGEDNACGFKHGRLQSGAGGSDQH